jgi:hypothetical protein
MNQPLFILAPPRSFTSVVCAMLGQHPQLYGLPEVNLFAGGRLGDLQRWYRLRPRFQHGLLRAIAELGLGAQNEATIVAAQRWCAEQVELTTATVFDDLRHWAAPRMPVDKSPLYAYAPGALERIRQAFPGARFLHLLRHPYTTCESFQKMRRQIHEEGGQPFDFAFNPEKIWLEPHLRIAEFLETVPVAQTLRLRGEVLLADPDCYLPQLAQWLGLDAGPAAIAAMKHPERSPFARLGPINARYGNDLGFMENPALRRFSPPAVTLETSWELGGRVWPLSAVLRHYAEFFGYQ